MRRCLLCGKEAERLACAHIFALGFFSALPSKARVDTVSMADGSGRKLRSALYDPNIICDACEHGIMQPLDDYGIQVIRDRKGSFRVSLPADAPMGMFVFDGVDKRKIRAFIASVLWRCSVSKQPELSNSSIGTVYENRIRDDLLHSGEFSYVDMVLFYLTHPMHGAFIMPVRKRLRPLDVNRDCQMINGWILQVPNISITVSLDKRPHPHRAFLALDPALTGREDSILASTCLKPEADQYNLMAMESERQESHLEDVVNAMHRLGMRRHAPHFTALPGRK